MTIVEDIGEERARLRTTFAAAGPNAPTLIAGWKAADLASHLAGQDRLGGVPAFLARSVVQRTRWRLTAWLSGRDTDEVELRGSLDDVGRLHQRLRI